MFAKFAIICTLAAAASTAGISPGYLSSAYALGTQQEHTIRGYGGLISLSKQAKAIDSPYSTVRKADIRFTNDAAYGAHPVAYTQHGHAYSSPTNYGFAAPGANYGYHAPAGTISYARHGYAPNSVSHGYAPTLSHGYTPTLGHGYAPTVAHGYAPSVAHGYTPSVAHGYAPSVAHGYTPAVAHRYAPTSVAHGYAPTTTVSHGYVAPSTVAHHGYPSLGYTHGTIAGAPTVTKGVIGGGLGVSYSPATAVSSSTFSGYGIHYGY